MRLSLRGVETAVRRSVVLSLPWLAASPAVAQVDPERADSYFAEAAMVCEREGGRLWGSRSAAPWSSPIR